MHTQGRARQLFSAGIGTIQQLANSDPFALCDTVDNLFPKQAKHLIQAAKVHFILNKYVTDRFKTGQTALKPSGPICNPAVTTQQISLSTAGGA